MYTKSQDNDDSRLPRPTKPKEKRNIAPLNPNIRARMQAQLPKLHRLQVMHDREDALLHLAGVLRAEDDHLHALEVDLDAGGGCHAGRETIGGELAGVVDYEVWVAEVRQLSQFVQFAISTLNDKRGEIEGREEKRTSSAVGRINMLFMNSAWYARAQTTRTLMRYLGSHPAKPSNTYTLSRVLR